MMPNKMKTIEQKIMKNPLLAFCFVKQKQKNQSAGWRSG